MIAYLRGTLIHKTPGRVIVDAGGVGYTAAIPVSSPSPSGSSGPPPSSPST